MTRVVAIGGGHGLVPALQALRLLDVEPTAIVTVADDGGSTGRLREDLEIIALGDLRMALLALARDADLAGVLAHRFQRGELEGHAVGNLVLVALHELSGGDDVEALRRAGALLGAGGTVLPATLVPVHLRARVAGRDIHGQVRVATADERVERVWLDPVDPPACAEAVAAIAAADVVVLGPGSLFTSVIAVLAVPGIRAALAASRARAVYVANLWQQSGEAAGLDLGAHVAALLAHAPGVTLDAVLAHAGPVCQGTTPVTGDLPPGAAGTVVHADLVAREPDGTLAYRHDPRRLAGALAPLLERAPIG